MTRLIRMNLRLALITTLLLSSFSLTLLASDPIHNDPQLDETIARANQYFLNARFDEGINLIKQLEKTRPESLAVSFFTANGYWWKIFRAYIFDKDSINNDADKTFDECLDQAIDRAEKRLTNNKADIQALFYLGNSYSLRSRVKGLRGSYFGAGRDAAKGKYYLEEVLKIDPNQYDAYYNLGVYNYFASTLPGFAKVLKALLFLPGGSRSKGLSLLQLAGQKSFYFRDEAQLVLARFYTDYEEQPYDALRIVQSFDNKYPGNAWFHYWLATLYSDELNDYYQAAPIYEQILADYDKGVSGYTTELRNQAWLKLARSYSRQLYPEKGIEEIQKLIASKPTKPVWTLPRAYLELGNIYDQIGMRSEAISAYHKVLNYADYRDFHDQAQKLLNQDYNQTAAKIYRANLEGRRLAVAGEYQLAQASFDKVLQQYPNNDQTLFAIAEMHFMKGSYGEASEMLNRVLDRRPKDPKWLLPGVYVRLGQVFEAQKQASAARILYEKALDTKFIASDDRNIAKRALKLMAQMKAAE